MVISLLTLNIFSLNLFVSAKKPEEPTLEFSWKETTYSYSFQKVWTGDSVIIDYSGNYKDTYKTYTGEYNQSENTRIEGEHTIFHEANYTCVSNTTIVGNMTFNIDFQVYRVDIDYGSNVKVIWIAFKQGIMEMEYYLTSYIQNFSYYEEYHQIIDSEFKEFSGVTGEVLDTWSTSDEIFGEKDYGYEKNNTRWPYFLHIEHYGEYTMPLILTIQLFTTEKRDKIAWVNMFYDFIIFKDSDSNAIYSIANEDSAGIPQLSTSNEKVGGMRPMTLAVKRNYTEYMDGSVGTSSGYYEYPIDKSISEIASSIKFTPPTNTSEANVTWGIEYPDFPTSAKFWDGENYFKTDLNSSYANSCPTNYSYMFDYNIRNNYTNLDITWELGKITNTSLYNVVQGYGLVMPHYNYFLSTFDIEEIDAKELTLPCELFAFESNDTVVAEINLGGTNKENYTLYDFPAVGVNTELESKGGSVHPLVVAFDELSSHYEDPLINSIYTLKDIVAQDPTFGIEDSLYRLEIQNYPVWNGEQLCHDPTLTVYFDEYEVEEDTDGKKPFIPGYNYTLLIGTAGIITYIIVLEKRKRKFNLT